MKHDFEERKAARIQRYKKKARLIKEQGETDFKKASKMGENMSGQPILIGHHSEKRHRRDLAKMHNLMTKSVQADQKAEHYKYKAEAAENNNAIFSDDPEAIQKLKNKIAFLEKRQELMKQANAIIRKGGDYQANLVKAGFPEDIARKITQPGRFQGMGYARFELTNNGAKIRSAKQRLEQLEKVTSSETTEIEKEGVKIVENVEANRLQIVFDDIPNKNIRIKLKSNGFRWSPSQGAWQRHLTPQAKYLAEKILNDDES